MKHKTHHLHFQHGISYGFLPLIFFSLCSPCNFKDRSTVVGDNITITRKGIFYLITQIRQTMINRNWAMNINTGDLQYSYWFRFDLFPPRSLLLPLVMDLRSICFKKAISSSLTFFLYSKDIATISPNSSNNGYSPTPSIGE